MDGIPLGLLSVWLIPETRQQKSGAIVVQKDDNLDDTLSYSAPRISAIRRLSGLLLFCSFIAPVALRVELRGFLLSVQAQQINKRQWDGMGS